MLHHGVTESSPSGCRQQYFSSGRHLAAAAGVNPATTLADRNQFRQYAGPTPDAIVEIRLFLPVVNQRLSISYTTSAQF